MSKERYTNAVGIGNREKNDAGEWLCRWCGSICPGRRTAWCSEECLHEASLRMNPSYMRSCVAERDKGLCKACGLDTKIIDRLIHILNGGAIRKNPEFRHGRGENYSLYLLKGEEIWGYRRAWYKRLRDYYNEENPMPNKHQFYIVDDLLEPLGIQIGSTGHLWEADHIIPVSEGGSCCGLENMQTLCISCHKLDTKELAKRTAEARDPQIKLFQSNLREGDNHA